MRWTIVAQNPHIYRLAQAERARRYQKLGLKYRIHANGWLQRSASLNWLDSILFTVLMRNASIS